MVNLHTPFLVAYVNEQLAGGAVFRYRRVSAAHARIGVQLLVDADNWWYAKADVANINVGDEATLYAPWQEYGNPRNLVPTVPFDMSGLTASDTTVNCGTGNALECVVYESPSASPHAVFFASLRARVAANSFADQTRLTLRVCDYNNVFCVERSVDLSAQPSPAVLTNVLQFAASLEGIRVIARVGQSIAYTFYIDASIVASDMPQPNPATVRAVVYVAAADGTTIATPYDGEASVAVYDLVLPSGVQDVGAMVLLP